MGSFGTQGNQRPQRSQTRIFAMTSGEAQANPDTVTGTMIVFGTPTRILFDTGSSRSFVSTTFALHANRKLVPLKNKLVVNTHWESKFFALQSLRGAKWSWRE